MSKRVRILATVALFLLFLASALVHARQDRGADKGRPQEKQHSTEGKQTGAKEHATPRQQERSQSARPAASGGHAEGHASHAAPSQAAPAVNGGERAVPRQGTTQSVSGGSQRPVSATHSTVVGKAEPRGAVRYPTEMRTKTTAREWQQQRGWQHQGGWGEHHTWHEHRAVRWEHDHRTWVQRGGYGGYYIPASHFHLYFGPTHFFQIHTRPVIVMGYPRFYYRGYWFMMVDPWPEFWAENWYAADDVYIDYDDGYYLHNRRHPGVAIAISVVL